MAFPPEVSILTESVVLETSESQYRSSRYQPHGTSFEKYPLFLAYMNPVDLTTL